MKIPPNACFVVTEAGANTTPEWRRAHAASVDHVLTHSFREAHGGAYRCVAQDDPVPEGTVPVVAPYEGTSDVQGALGYHDDGGIHIFRDGLSDDDLSVTGSHEIFEAALDPGANRWADSGAGEEVAIEDCDAVEAFSFVPPGCTAPVSDFLLPSFFDPDGVRPFSHMDKPTAPFQTVTDGGANYQLVRAVDENGVQQVTARGTIASHRKKAKGHPSSRTSRRGLRSS